MSRTPPPPTTASTQPAAVAARSRPSTSYSSTLPHSHDVAPAPGAGFSPPQGQTTPRISVIAGSTRGCRIMRWAHRGALRSE